MSLGCVNSSLKWVAVVAGGLITLSVLLVGAAGYLLSSLFSDPYPGLSGTATVIFRAGSASEKPGQEIARIRIPGNYVDRKKLFAADIRQEQSGAISLRWLPVAFTYPDGGLPPATRDLARYRMFTAEVNAITQRSAYDLEYLYPRRTKPGDSLQYSIRYEGKLFGLDRYVTSNRSDDYYGTDNDDFHRIHCAVESRPANYCTYYVVLGTGFVAKVDFVDFRFHGGREFANERVRSFKRVLCPYVKCAAGAGE